MTWMDRLERKFGKYAISNISRYLVFAVLIGYVISFINEPLRSTVGISVTDFFAFDAGRILHFQIWRLVSWIFCIPPSSSFIFCMIFLLCLIPMGRTLESFLGAFKMNVYIIGGILLSDIGGLLVYAFTYFALGMGLPVYLSAYYILLSMFMALAICVPDATVNLYFILPIRMKWMLLIYIVDLGYEIFMYFSAGVAMGSWLIGFVYSTEIIFAVLNLILFFVFVRQKISRKHRKRQKEFQAQFRQPRQGSGIIHHKCAICGRTELDDPELVFRFCSKCAGGKEYCQEHLFTHEHVR